MKYLIAFLLLVSPALAADPGFYRAGDGVFMGTGTGFGTEADILRDLQLDVVELTTLDMPGWYVYNDTLSATVTGAWSGGWSYQNDPILPDLLVVGVDDAWAAYCLREWTWEYCPVGTVEISGEWDTEDLGGGRIDHLSIFKARAPMVDTTCHQVPEPSTGVQVLMVVVFVGSLICCGFALEGRR